MKRKFELELTLDQISALNIEPRKKINILHEWLYEISPQKYINFLCDFANWVLAKSEFPKDNFRNCALLCLDYIRDFIHTEDRTLLDMAELMSLGLCEKYKNEYGENNMALHAVNSLCSYIEDESHVSLSALHKILIAARVYCGEDVCHDWVISELVKRTKELIPC